MKLAAIAYHLRPIRSEADFHAHVLEMLDRCGDAGAEVAVFPECFPLELLHLRPELPPAEMAAAIPPGVLEPLAQRARELGIAVFAGSTFFPGRDGFENACPVFWPDGRTDVQPKVVLTQYEIAEWGVLPGRGLRRLADNRFAATVCYDCEFPESGRAVAEGGALVQCVPAFTETEHGYWRVRHCCQARAVENQIFVAHASLLGSLGREPVPQAVGASAIYAPCVEPFPADGVLAQTPFGEEGIAVADLDLEALLAARTQGDVRNWDDRRRGDWSYLSPPVDR